MKIHVLVHVSQQRCFFIASDWRTVFAASKTEARFKSSCSIFRKLKPCLYIHIFDDIIPTRYYWSPVYSLYKWPVIRSFDAFHVVSINRDLTNSRWAGWKRYATYVSPQYWHIYTHMGFRILQYGRLDLLAVSCICNIILWSMLCIRHSVRNVELAHRLQTRWLRRIQTIVVICIIMVELPVLNAMMFHWGSPEGYG